MSKNKLFFCFVDYQKAFDTTNRLNIWYKNLKLRVDEKLFSVISFMYEDVKLYVEQYNFKLVFKSDLGIFQGEITSPKLFPPILNDIGDYLHKNINVGITIDQLSIYLLLSADDAVTET